MSERLTAERVEEIRTFAEGFSGNKDVLALLADRTALEERVRVLEEALRIYADEDNWFSGFEWDYTTPTIERDYGWLVAAQALEPKK